MASSEVVMDAILNMLNNTAPTIARDGAYLSLHTGDPGVTGANEATGVAYARVLVDAANWGAPTGVAGTNRHIANGTLVQFATPGAGGWGSITHLALWITLAGATAADFWSGGILTNGPKTAGEGADVNFPIAAARWQVD